MCDYNKNFTLKQVRFTMLNENDNLYKRKTTIKSGAGYTKKILYNYVIQQSHWNNCQSSMLFFVQNTENQN